MGKYMRKGKGAGKVALMEVSQGSLGVRTRAKTLALVEQDRKLASARRPGSSKHEHKGVGNHFHAPYLELRSRKLEKVVREIERRGRGGIPSTESTFIEDCKNFLKVANATAADVPELTTVSHVEELFLLNGEVVGSSPTPQLSPRRHADGCQICKDFPIESATITQRTTAFDGAQLRCSESLAASAEATVRSGNVPQRIPLDGDLDHTTGQGAVSPIEDGLSRDGLSNRRLEVENSCCEHPSGELAISSVRKKYFSGSSPSKERKGDPGPSSRAGILVDRQDRRMANHHRMMNRRYMRTSLFSDANAIDELFAAPEAKEREEGKRFTEKYNYDVFKDKPLKGRYEWVSAVEPCSTTPTTQHLADQQQPIRS